MKIALFALFVTVSNFLYAHGQITSIQTKRIPGFVCYGGHVLSSSGVGFAWEANRSCFISHKPCGNYQAYNYGHYYNPQHLRQAYANCRSTHPFRWGNQD